MLSAAGTPFQFDVATAPMGQAHDNGVANWDLDFLLSSPPPAPLDEAAQIAAWNFVMDGANTGETTDDLALDADFLFGDWSSPLVQDPTSSPNTSPCSSKQGTPEEAAPAEDDNVQPLAAGCMYVWPELPTTPDEQPWPQQAAAPTEHPRNVYEYAVPSSLAGAFEGLPSEPVIPWARGPVGVESLPLPSPLPSPSPSPVGPWPTGPTGPWLAAPVAAPVAAPFAAPFAAPVAAPVAAPFAAPFAAPVAAPFAAPTSAPTSAPMQSGPSCLHGSPHVIAPAIAPGFSSEGIAPAPRKSKHLPKAAAAERKTRAPSAAPLRWTFSGSPDGGVKPDGLHAANGRILLACEFCKGRKLKCDGTRPACDECRRRGKACSYPEAVRRRGKAKKTLEREANERAAQEEAATVRAAEERAAQEEAAAARAAEEQAARAALAAAGFVPQATEASMVGMSLEDLLVVLNLALKTQGMA